jgi:hypothetical protein
VFQTSYVDALLFRRPQRNLTGSSKREPGTRTRQTMTHMNHEIAITNVIQYEERVEMVLVD